MPATVVELPAARPQRRSQNPVSIPQKNTARVPGVMNQPGAESNGGKPFTPAGAGECPEVAPSWSKTPRAGRP